MCSRGSRAAHIRCRGDPPRVLVCLAVRPPTRGHTPSPPRISLQIPETLAACGFSEASPSTSSLYSSTPLEGSPKPTNSLAKAQTTRWRSQALITSPASSAVNRDARIVHLDPSIYRRNAQGRPRSGAGRHANATASAPAARRGLAPPPSAAAPDAPLRLVSKDKTPESSGEGRRRGAGRRRRADGVRARIGQDPSRSRFEEDRSFGSS